ncbi:alpha/beta-Hydrolase [Glarea lozoyensis ATCC 20868]|uniref:Carboxylic ester hydrolase n=1 Tax=Glarea lozoyensis (strain ATCC 20868 / MF5171) TaxID=1116229 RepID=S3DH21_GLAL2|nr:alpha/beta-Hydrolase [Glarea lozoyensis ATCC 20868]EPE37010.1 alpha/beta-Hydrolase [Glarea lozoyensis ATCC 20868]
MYFRAILPFLVASATATQNKLLQIPNSEFGPNPSNVSFYLYIPTKLASNPPVLVNPHWCHGSAQAAFTGTQLATLADTYGYIMIFPSSPNTADYCWDVSSPATLTHNGGGDSRGIVSMVDYVLKKYKADPRRVFSMGTSSGAMMTNVLLGAYPDVFAAGSAWAGVAFGCYADAKGGVNTWSDACATGKVVKSGGEWKGIVEGGFPGYKGWRPKMHVLHGTVDEVLAVQNLEEEIKEWTAVLGLGNVTAVVRENDINAGWTTQSWSVGGVERFRATKAKGVTHNIQTDAETVLNWFDLKCKGPGCFSRPSNSRFGRRAVI